MPRIAFPFLRKQSGSAPLIRKRPAGMSACGIATAARQNSRSHLRRSHYQFREPHRDQPAEEFTPPRALRWRWSACEPPATRSRPRTRRRRVLRPLARCKKCRFNMSSAKPSKISSRARCAGNAKHVPLRWKIAADEIKAAIGDVSNELIDDLDDALAGHEVDLTIELLKDILLAVGINRITAQQFAVLRAAISGDSDKQIADRLQIHENTVQLHWREIRSRLGIASKLQLGAYVVAETCGNPQI